MMLLSYTKSWDPLNPKRGQENRVVRISQSDNLIAGSAYAMGLAIEEVIYSFPGILRIKQDDLINDRFQPTVRRPSSSTRARCSSR